MSRSLLFRNLEEADTRRLPVLFEETLNDGKDEKFWHWKYFENPAGENMTMVAVEGSRLVGNVGGLPVRMQVAGGAVLASQGVDTAVSAAHRKRNTFFTLESGVRKRMEEKGVRFTYAFSIKETYRIFTHVLDFEGVCPVFSMAKVLNPTPYLEQKLGPGVLSKHLGMAGRQAIAGISKAKTVIPSGLKMVEITGFDTRFDDFWRAQSNRYDIAVIRDRAYLNWRYVGSPIPYNIFSIENAQDRSIMGFIVLGCYEEDVRRGRIVDILVNMGDHTIVDLLVERAIHYFMDKKVDVITCWMLEQSPIMDCLKKKGFTQRRTNHDLMVRSYLTALDKQYLSDSSRWYMTMGDSDYY